MEWKGTDEEAEKEESSVVLIYMFIAPRWGGDGACLRVFDGHVQLSTLLFPQQRSLTAQHANTDEPDAHTFLQASCACRENELVSVQRGCM